MRSPRKSFELLITTAMAFWTKKSSRLRSSSFTKRFDADRDPLVYLVYPRFPRLHACSPPAPCFPPPSLTPPHDHSTIPSKVRILPLLTLDVPAKPEIRLLMFFYGHVDPADPTRDHRLDLPGFRLLVRDQVVPRGPLWHRSLAMKILHGYIILLVTIPLLTRALSPVLAHAPVEVPHEIRTMLAAVLASQLRQWIFVSSVLPALDERTVSKARERVHTKSGTTDRTRESLPAEAWERPKPPRLRTPLPSPMGAASRPASPPPSRLCCGRERRRRYDAALT